MNKLVQIILTLIAMGLLPASCAEVTTTTLPTTQTTGTLLSTSTTRITTTTGITTTTSSGTTSEIIITIDEPDLSWVLGRNVYTTGEEGLSANADLQGFPLVSVQIDDAFLGNDDYDLSGGILYLSPALLDTLSFGNHIVMLETTRGAVGISFICNDVPTISPKNDFIKYPGESVENEDFRGLVNNEVGSITVSYERAAGDGVLTDHLDGTFDYIPATNRAGTATITLTATDQYGATASRDITLTYKTVDPGVIADQPFDLDAPADVTFSVDKNGAEPVAFPCDFVSVTGHGITAADYLFDDASDTVTILSTYLSTLSFGRYEFLLTTTAGVRAFAIVVSAHPTGSVVGSDVLVKGDTADLLIDVDAKGGTIVSVAVNGTNLVSSFYTFDGTRLVLSGSYLDTLSPGDKTADIVLTAGSIAIPFVLNDVPVIAAKNDFVKLPGETVSHESFAGLVTDVVGTRSLSYVLVSGDGILTDHADNTFSFVPGGVYAGSVVITVTATDEYGASASRDITLTYKTVTPYIYDATGSKVVDKADAFLDVVMTVDTFGTESSSLYYEMTDVLESGVSIGAANFILRTNGNARYFSVKASYLMTLSVGVHTFTLETVAGSADFTIEVEDSRAVSSNPTDVDYIKTVTASDLTFTITPYAHVLDSADFSITGAAWVALADFGYAAGVLTIEEAFLETLAAGDHVVSVEGVALFTIHIKNPTGPQVVAGSKTTIIEKAVISADRIIWTSLYGREAETVVSTGGYDLALEAYAVGIERIILRQAYLSSLPYGTYVFTITNTHGTDTFTVLISDRPTANEGSQNVTKYTYETISGEPFRVTAVAPWELSHFLFAGGVSYYNYVITPVGEPEPEGANVALDQKSIYGAFGTITIDDATGSFSFDRAPGWWGVVIFDYRAFDTAGLSSVFILMDVVYLETSPVIADATDKTYLAGQGSVRWPITNASGNSFFPIWKILHGTEELVKDTDFTVGPQEGSTLYFDLTASYLSTLAYGVHDFTLYTEGGSADFRITILGTPTSTDTTAEFDLANPADVTFQLTGYPLSSASVTRNAVPLAPAYYTFVDGLLTIKSGFLSVQGYTTVVIRVTNATGFVDLSIMILDTRTPELGAGPFDYVEHSMVDVDIPLSLYDASLTAIKFGLDTVPGSAYDVALGVLTIDGSYLESLLGTLTEFDFTIETSDGTLDLTIALTPFTALPEALLLSDGYKIDLPGDVSYGIDLNENVFSGLTAGLTTLVLDTDYTYDAGTGILVLKASWLMARRATEGDIAFVIRTADENDLQVTIPFDHLANRVDNGGFETASLSGWTSFSLWKNEPGMTAWTSDRVVSGTYFDPNYSYNRDGAYNLGIYGGTISKDSGQERMGYLRSSDFTLGGSGWISFKLGGGKNDAFAYVSIRRAVDDVEVARFGNRHFGNTTLSGTLNAEAFLFPYYYDLSQVGTLGTTYYLVIADTMSNEWCVLSADSFVTYYASAPVTTADTLAENVVPVILGTGTATNEIKNGNFASGLDSWSNPDGVFQVIDGHAISSVGGDGSTGILRSSAFTVVGMKYLRFDWAGALRFDKQVCIVIREVGTNIEVLRYVRRDNLSTKQDGNFDNHMLDLSMLDESKQYYLEIIDNVNTSWGVAKIDAIRFVTETEWNAVTVNDRAVRITGLPLNFDLPL